MGDYLSCQNFRIVCDFLHLGYNMLCNVKPFGLFIITQINFQLSWGLKLTSSLDDISNMVDWSYDFSVAESLCKCVGSRDCPSHGNSYDGGSNRSLGWWKATGRHSLFSFKKWRLRITFVKWPYNMIIFPPHLVLSF